MQSDAIFRFVSIRPPERKGKEYTPNTAVSAPGDALDVFKTHIDGVVANVSSAEEIVEAVTVRVIQSSDYYTNNSYWKPLLEQARVFHEILRAAAQKGDPELFKTRLADALSSVLGEEVAVEDIPQSERFANLKTSIWLSYYASALSSKPLPGSSREIIDWIRFLAVVEVLDNDELLKRRLSIYHRIRPTLPFALPALVYQRDKDIQTRAQKEVPARHAAYNKAAAIKTLQEKRARLKQTRAELVALQRGKLADAERRAQKRRESVGRAPKSQNISEKGDKDRDRAVQQSPPWRLNEQDLKGRDELRRRMDEFHLDVDQATLPQMIHRLDTAIAACNRQLAELQSEYVVIPIGRTLARVKRRTK